MVERIMAINNNNGRLTIIGCFLCGPYCFKHFTDPNSLNLYNSPARWVLLFSHFVQDRMKLRASLEAQW